jgi:predicted DNA-binding transcriptional regulator YafY
MVEITYRPEEGTGWTSRVEPWAVVVRQGRWYLLSRRVSSGAMRTYRLDRVRGVTMLTDEFDLPADIDPVALLEANFAVGWEFPTEVEIAASAEQLAGWLPRSIGRLEPIDADHCRLVGSTSDPVWYAEVVASIPAPFRVVSGPELRDAVRALGERLIAAAGD